ncbi:MAG: TldD/PmbA family protein [Clostridia bacterium]|nr:TldD/PmbA family protein [Clostridia bacterium]
MEKFDILKKIVKECSEKQGIAEYELYYSEDTGIRAETFRDEISAFSSSVGGSLLYRCIVDGRLGYASTQYLDEGEMEQLVARAVENAAVIEKEEEAIIYGGASPDAYRQVPLCNFVMPSASVIRERAMQNRDLLYAADGQIADGTTAAAWAGQSRIRLFNSNGLDLSSFTGNMGEMFRVVLDDGTEKQTGFASLHNSFTDGSAARAEKLQEALGKARDKFGAGKVKSGKYNVVFQNSQMETLLSAFLSVFFAENVQKGLSLLKGKIGEKIAADCVTLTDDPFSEGNTVQVSFDGEGVPTRCKNVVENGVLKTFLYNLSSARKDGVESTGNASRGAASIGTRVYTFYLGRGGLTRQQLLEKADNGIYVTGMKGLHAGANAVTGEFSIESEGFLLENGKIGAPVKSFTVAGNFFDLLKQISDMDDELDMSTPGGSRVLAPDVLVPGMSVAGE